MLYSSSSKNIDRHFLLVGRAEVGELERDRLGAVAHLDGDREASARVDAAADDCGLAIVLGLGFEALDDDLVTDGERRREALELVDERDARGERLGRRAAVGLRGVAAVVNDVADEVGERVAAAAEAIVVGTCTASYRGVAVELHDGPNAQGLRVGACNLLTRHLPEEYACYNTGHSRRSESAFAKEDKGTLLEANNYANCLLWLKRFEESKALFRKIIPVARRVSGDGNEDTLMMRMNYGQALFEDDGATLEDLREAVTTFAEIERTARRVLGGARPLTKSIGISLHESRATLAARA